MEPRPFTWFPKLTDITNELAAEFPELVGEFCAAVSNYGTYGIEPEFSSAVLKYAFMGVRADIDNSLSARTRNRGGRPAVRKPVPNGDAETEKTGVSNLETGVSNPETGVSEVKTGVSKPETGVTESETPPYIPVYAMPNQSMPNQAKPEVEKRPRKRAPFTAPTADEVAEFAKEDDLSLDAEKFVDYYAAQGWKLSNGNAMRDWKAAVRNWARRDRRSRSPSDPFNRGEVSSEYANL